MKKVIFACLSFMIFIVFVIPITRPVLTAQEKMQIIRGHIVCVEADKERNIITKEEYTNCNGLLVVIGTDGKTYTVSGTGQYMKQIEKSPKRRMGYLAILRIKGEVRGNPRSWHLYLPSSEPQGSMSSVVKTIKGVIFCLIPDYEKGIIIPMISDVPCNEFKPHSHIAYTNEDKIYILHGTEDAVSMIEKNPRRVDVTLKGEIHGNEKGQILYLN